MKRQYKYLQGYMLCWQKEECHPLRLRNSQKNHRSFDRRLHLLYTKVDYLDFPEDGHQLRLLQKRHRQ